MISTAEVTERPLKKYQDGLLEIVWDVIENHLELVEREVRRALDALGR